MPGTRSLLLLTCVLLAACNSPLPQPGSGYSRTSSAYAPEPAPHQGGSAVYSDWQFPPDLNPVYDTSQSSREVQVAIFAGLQDIDDHLQYRPDLAQDVPTEENGLVRRDTASGAMTVTYDLRPGLAWSDGQPLTAQDVEFTWQAIMHAPPDLGVNQAGYDQVTGFEIRDDRHFTIHFKRVYPAFVDLFQHNVIPRHILGGTAWADLPRHPFWSKPTACSGPFAVDEVGAGDHVTLVRNPHYADARGRRAAVLDRVTFQVFPEKEAMVAAADAAKTDLALGLYERDLDVALRSSQRVVETPILEYDHVSFNWADPNPLTSAPPPWAGDPKLVQALRQSVDVQSLVGRASHGLAPVARGPLLAGGWVPPVPASPPYDATQAAARLDADGWTAGPDGIRSRHGVRLAFSLSTYQGNPLRLGLAGDLVSAWRRVGADVTLTEVPADQFLGTWAAGGSVAHGQFEAAMWISAVAPDPDSVYPLFDSSGIPSVSNPAGADFAQLRSSAIDQALDGGRSTLDLGARRRAYSAFGQAWLDSGTEVPLYQRLSVDLVASRLHNFRPHPWPWATDAWNIGDWWVQ
ncbi:MAG: peptide ABC transporter substrate-binding protein [Candidatus Dormibacteria bacterium]